MKLRSKSVVRRGQFLFLSHDLSEKRHFSLRILSATAQKSPKSWQSRGSQQGLPKRCLVGQYVLVFLPVEDRSFAFSSGRVYPAAQAASAEAVTIAGVTKYLQNAKGARIVAECDAGETTFYRKLKEIGKGAAEWSVFVNNRFGRTNGRGCLTSSHR